MNCNEYRAQVSAFLDEELSNSEIRDLFQHLAACDGCWTYNLRLQKIRSALRHGAPLREGVVAEHEKPWMHQRLPVSAPSLVLTLFVAFLFGALLSLVLSSRPPIDRLDSDTWQSGQIYRYPSQLPYRTISSSGTGLNGGR